MAAAKLMRDYCIPNAQRMAISVGLEPNLDQLWFQLLTMHVYNAGAGNVRKAVAAVGTVRNGEELILKLWKTQAGLLVIHLRTILSWLWRVISTTLIG